MREERFAVENERREGEERMRRKNLEGTLETAD